MRFSVLSFINIKQSMRKSIHGFLFPCMVMGLRLAFGPPELRYNLEVSTARGDTMEMQMAFLDSPATNADIMNAQ